MPTIKEAMDFYPIWIIISHCLKSNSDHQDVAESHRAYFPTISSVAHFYGVEGCAAKEHVLVPHSKLHQTRVMVDFFRNTVC